MVVPVENYYPEMPIPLTEYGKRPLADDLVRESPGSSNTTKHVVIVMDGLKEFNMEALEWALNNITVAGSDVTLLGTMPWLNIPQSTKTSDVWTVEFEDLPFLREKSDWKSNIKYQQLQAVIDLCRKHGVVPQKKVAMGFPLRLLVVEQITKLHATWVVFDRHHKKNREFFAQKIPCNMVMMNEDGDVDLIKGRPMIDNGENTPWESPSSLAPTPQLVISEQLREILQDRAPQHEED